MIKPMKYALHPGSVFSSDGDTHYITADQLRRLYQLPPVLCIEWDIYKPRTYMGRQWDDYIHLYPRSDGHYHSR